MTKKRPSLPLTEEQLKRIVELLLNKHKNHKGVKQRFTSFRNATLFPFMFYCQGLRPRECFGARLEYLDLRNNKLYIPSTNNKTRTQDNVNIPPKIVKSLKNYLQFRNQLYPDSPYLFPSLNGGLIDRSTLAKSFRKTLKEAKIYQVNFKDQLGKNRGNYNLYSLRKGFGTLVYSKTHDILAVSKLLRHKDIATTSRNYVLVDDKVNREILSDLFKKNKVKPTIVNVDKSINTTNIQNNILLQFIQQQQETNKLLVEAIQKLSKR